MIRLKYTSASKATEESLEIIVKAETADEALSEMKKLLPSYAIENMGWGVVEGVSTPVLRGPSESNKSDGFGGQSPVAAQNSASAQSLTELEPDGIPPCHEQAPEPSPLNPCITCPSSVPPSSEAVLLEIRDLLRAGLFVDAALIDEMNHMDGKS